MQKGGTLPVEANMLQGDSLFFGGPANNGRPYNVNHVEMYVGSGQLSGHGSGIGPTRKNMQSYVKQRNSVGKKFIGVKRYIKKDASDGKAPNTAPTTSPKSTVVRAYQLWLNANYASIVKKAIGKLLDGTGTYAGLTREAGLAVWKDVMNRKHGEKLTLTNKNFLDSCKAAARKHGVLQKGTSGTFVAIAQGILAGQGLYHGGIDSSFGTLTDNAVREFQKKYKLKVDGVIGQDTWFKMFNL